MTRTPIPAPELVADLDQLGQAAVVIHGSLSELLDNHLLPAGALPSFHAARRAAQSLVTHIEASAQLVEVARG